MFFNKSNKKDIDIVSSIFKRIAHVFYKEEIYAFHLRLNREKAIYYNEDISKIISPILFRALILAEDRRFDFHGGIDFIAILRAILYSLQYGKIQGASTIEQQLTRVVINRYERTIKRKIHEILLAVCVKEVLSKEEILGIYLRIAYFGYRMKGIEAACNKLRYSLGTLSIVQSVNLVARIRYPEPSVKQEESVRRNGFKRIKKRSKKIVFLLQKKELAIREIIERRYNFLFPGSEINRKLINRYPPALNFLMAGEKLDERGKEALVRGFISEGIPAVFQRDPLYYENIRELIACCLKIHPKCVTLIGSVRLGYSIAPRKYGQLMNEKSDLDIAVISQSLFKNMARVFYKWKKDFRKSKINSSNGKEKKYWEDNLYIVPKNIKREFIDVNKISSKYILPAKIKEVCNLVENDIRKFSEAPHVSKVSIRIYKNWNAFFVQNVLNLNYTIEEVGKKK